MAEDRLVIIQLPDETSQDEMIQFREWMENHQLNGYTFLLMRGWHGFTKEEMKPLLEKLEKIMK